MRKLAVFNLMLVLLLIGFQSGCIRSQDSFFSMEEGETSEYQISSSGRVAKLIVTNMGPRELINKQVITYKIERGDHVVFSFLSQDTNGLYEYAFQEEGASEPIVREIPKNILKYPIKVGNSWVRGNELSLLIKDLSVEYKSVIESVNDTVTVPLGTFNNCIRVKSTGTAMKPANGWLGNATINVEVYDWYAQGVGCIKTFAKEQSDKYGSTEVLIQLAKYKKGAETQYSFIRSKSTIAIAPIVLLAFISIIFVVNVKRKRAKNETIERIKQEQYCCQCGNIIPSGSKFCTNCGTKIS